MGATLGIFGEDFLTWRFLFASPFIIAALFGASIAILEVRDGVLRYRRFFTWTTIRDDEMVAAGVIWPPFIGYLRLNRFIFPWGRVYFVLDENLNANPFRRGDYPLLRYVRKEPVPSETESAKSSQVKDRSLKLKLLIAGVSGALSSCLLRITVPNLPSRSVLEDPFGPKQPAFIVVAERVIHLLNSFPVILALFMVSIFLVTFRRNRHRTWIFAFLAGLSFPYILFHWL
jgi:hypothetical protein